MNIRLFLSIVLSTAFMTVPAWAGSSVKETWKIRWSGGSCKLELSYDTEDMSGPAKPRGCRGALRNAKSFVYTDDDKSELILFARKGARGDILAAFEKSGGKKMRGLVGDGDPAEMFLASTSTTSSSVNITIGGGVATGSDCVTYADDGSCVGKSELKNPKIRFGDPIDMLALSNQKIYPFSGGKGFPKDERMQAGACYIVKKCERAFGSDEDWCEVVLEDGFFTGWVKRKDDDKVYFSKGC